MSNFMDMLYEAEFAQARRISYVVILGLLTFALFLPLHYSCGETGTACLGCGFRAGMVCVSQFKLTEAAAASPLVFPALLVFLFMTLDVLVMAHRCGGQIHPHIGEKNAHKSLGGHQ